MSEVTQLLQRANAGDAAAREPLYRLLYPELMRLARSHLSRAGTLSLDAPGLLHDAYLRLTANRTLPDTNRRVFFAYASRVMRSVIVDYVRERNAQKRGGGVQSVTLTSGLGETIFTEHSLTDIERALTALENLDARAYRVVEMRYFAGLTEEDIAGVLEVSVPTVKRDWRKARAFLYGQLC
ncbi:MAG: sigma-70 family RNA polymerase sigma factor [Proteobacteria bacterium]|nr:sigma-70 family RNA polymerase sigma factor [Pseudomonadota bacterium]